MSTNLHPQAGDRYVPRLLTISIQIEDLTSWLLHFCQRHSQAPPPTSSLPPHLPIHALPHSPQIYVHPPRAHHLAPRPHYGGHSPTRRHLHRALHHRPPHWGDSAPCPYHQQHRHHNPLLYRPHPFLHRIPPHCTLPPRYTLLRAQPPRHTYPTPTAPVH